MHTHLRKILAVALHPATCDGEATAAFAAARRLAAASEAPGFAEAEAEVIANSETRAGTLREGRAGVAEQRTSWRVSIRADRLHEFLGALVAKANAAGVQFSLTTFALLGRHVHTPSRLEFALSGTRQEVDKLDRWIEFYMLGAGFRRRRGNEQREAISRRGETVFCMQ